jgi:hypothetical protein
LRRPNAPNFPFPKREITGRFTGQTEYFGLKIRTKLQFVQYLLGFLAFFDRLKITGRDFRKTGKQRPKTATENRKIFCGTCGKLTDALYVLHRLVIGLATDTKQTRLRGVAFFGRMLLARRLIGFPSSCEFCAGQ